MTARENNNSMPVRRSFKSFLWYPFLLTGKIICLLRSWYYTRKVTEGAGKIKILTPFIKFRIVKARNSKLILHGNLIIQEHSGLKGPVYINLSENATLQSDGRFTLGSGVRLIVSAGAGLFFGGQRDESSSGITADTLVMVYKKITIGKDFICAWNAFISDSDWHSIEGQSHSEDISIGDHVWIANSTSVLKGSRIGNNCIIGSHSKVTRGVYADHTIIAGVPQKL